MIKEEITTDTPVSQLSTIASGSKPPINNPLTKFPSKWKTLYEKRYSTDYMFVFAHELTGAYPYPLKLEDCPLTKFCHYFVKRPDDKDSKPWIVGMIQFHKIMNHKHYAESYPWFDNQIHWIRVYTNAAMDPTTVYKEWLDPTQNRHTDFPVVTHGVFEPKQFVQSSRIVRDVESDIQQFVSSNDAAKFKKTATYKKMTKADWHRLREIRADIKLKVEDDITNPVKIVYYKIIYDTAITARDAKNKQLKARPSTKRPFTEEQLAKRKTKRLAQTRYPPPKVKVGDRGTFYVGSDSYAKQVVKVSKKGREIEVRGLDENEITGELTLREDGNKYVFTWRSTSGIYIQKGELNYKSGTFELGKAITYLDPHF